MWVGGAGGLIPARAGKTWSRRGLWSWRGAHPRACGENGTCTRRPRLWVGSSPRVRGKPAGGPGVAGRRGLIPARAGKTVGVGVERSYAGAHPRACGENHALLVNDPSALGSSPRVRGKRSWRRGRVGLRRLIPARAGKTRILNCWGWMGTAHPRACGENLDARPAPTRRHGSSPRVRGKRAHEDRRGTRRGLIPARAGKTHCRRLWGRLCGAHPRACGENNLSPDPLPAITGSSPRVRGKRRRRRQHGPRPRLIPARAGKTLDGAGRDLARGAHPRACGENATAIPAGAAARGSSPRVRGKRPGSEPSRDPRGLIPARAGKTARA